MTGLAPSGPSEATIPETANMSTPGSICDRPKADQRILHENRTYTTIKEGLAYVLIPPDAPLSQDPNLSKGEGPAQSVFYNPIQQYNRDLTVLAIRAFGEAHVAEKMAKIEQLRTKRQKKVGKKQQKGQAKGQDVAQGTKKRSRDEASVAEDIQEPETKKSKSDRNRCVERSEQFSFEDCQEFIDLDLDLASTNSFLQYIRPT
jgi:tRNA (guanine26-N2/guanine27-N2)-dimethyltransferase